MTMTDTTSRVALAGIFSIAAVLIVSMLGPHHLPRDVEAGLARALTGPVLSPPVHLAQHHHSTEPHEAPKDLPADLPAEKQTRANSRRNQVNIRGRDLSRPLQRVTSVIFVPEVIVDLVCCCARRTARPRREARSSSTRCLTQPALPTPSLFRHLLGRCSPFRPRILLR